jgi:peptide/nickel transport system substrate-binding protein
VLALVALVCTGCAKDKTPAVSAKGGDGVLRLSFPGEPRTLNPNASPLDEYALFIGQNIFSKLVSLADDGRVLPDVAEQWTESDDGLSYTFRLRSDVRWHDGRPLTSDDVRSTFAQIATSSNSELAAHVAGVDAIDRTTVRVRLKAPWAAFITNVAFYGASILPAHVYGAARWAEHPANLRPIGSGPFKFVSWERGRRIVLEKNVDYFGQGPYVDGLDFTIANSAREAAQQVVDGQCDLLFGRPPVAMVADLSRAPGIRVTTAPSDGRTYLAFNMRRPPFDDLRARRAVNQAIDRRAIVERVLAGYGTPALGFYIPSVEWAYNGEARVPLFDLRAARRLAAESIAQGTRLTLMVPARPGTPSPLGMELVSQLAAAGLAVDVRLVELAKYYEVVRQHDFDIAVLAGAQGPDPDAMATRFGSSGAMQVMGYSSAALDEALARGSRQTDPVARADAYRRAQEILAVDLPVAPLYEGVDIAVYRDRVRGVPQADARGLVPFFTFNLARLRGAS